MSKERKKFWEVQTLVEGQWRLWANCTTKAEALAEARSSKPAIIAAYGGWYPIRVVRYDAPTPTVCGDYGTVSLASTGWALFEGDTLIRCGTGLKAKGSSHPRGRKMPGRMTAASDFLQGVPADRLILEVPKAYPGGRSEGDPNNLMPLWGVAGAILSTHNSSEQWVILPRDWKGTVDPIVMFRRIILKLTPDELAIWNKSCRPRHAPRDLSAPSSKSQQSGDALDAIGIGLTVFGRLGRGNPLK